MRKPTEARETLTPKAQAVISRHERIDRLKRRSAIGALAAATLIAAMYSLSDPKNAPQKPTNNSPNTPVASEPDSNTEKPVTKNRPEKSEKGLQLNDDTDSEEKSDPKFEAITELEFLMDDFEGFKQECKSFLQETPATYSMEGNIHIREFIDNYEKFVHFLGQHMTSVQGTDKELSVPDSIAIRNEICGTRDFEKDMKAAISKSVRGILLSPNLNTFEKQFILQEYVNAAENLLDHRTYDNSILQDLGINNDVFTEANLPFTIYEGFAGTKVQDEKIDRNMAQEALQFYKSTLERIEKLEPHTDEFIRQKRALREGESLILKIMHALHPDDKEMNFNKFTGEDLVEIMDKYH